MRRLRSAFLTGEFLVSLTVLIPIMLVLIGVFPFAYGMDHKAADFSDAQEIARDQLEKLRARPFEDVSSYVVTETRGKLSLQVKVVVSDWPAGQPVVRQKRADVQVSWRNETLSVQSYLYRWAP